MNQLQVNEIIAMLRERQPLHTLDELAWRDELRNLDYDEVMLALVEGAKGGIIRVKDVANIESPEQRARNRAESMWLRVAGEISREGQRDSIDRASRGELINPRVSAAVMVSRREIREEPVWKARQAFLKAYSSHDEGGEPILTAEFAAEIGQGSLLELNAYGELDG